MKGLDMKMVKTVLLVIVSISNVCFGDVNAKIASGLEEIRKKGPVVYPSSGRSAKQAKEDFLRPIIEKMSIDEIIVLHSTSLKKSYGKQKRETFNANGLTEQMRKTALRNLAKYNVRNQSDINKLILNDKIFKRLNGAALEEVVANPLRHGWVIPEAVSPQKKNALRRLIRHNVLSSEKENKLISDGVFTKQDIQVIKMQDAGSDPHPVVYVDPNTDISGVWGNDRIYVLPDTMEYLSGDGIFGDGTTLKILPRTIILIDGFYPSLWANRGAKLTIGLPGKVIIDPADPNRLIEITDTNDSGINQPIEPVYFFSLDGTGTHLDFYCPIIIDEDASPDCLVTNIYVENAFTGSLYFRDLKNPLMNHKYVSCFYGVVQFAQFAQFINIEAFYCGSVVLDDYGILNRGAAFEVFTEPSDPCDPNQTEQSAFVGIAYCTAERNDHFAAIHGRADPNYPTVVVMLNNISTSSFISAIELTDGYIIPLVIGQVFGNCASWSNMPIEYVDMQEVYESPYAWNGIDMNLYLDPNSGLIGTGFGDIGDMPFIIGRSVLENREIDMTNSPGYHPLWGLKNHGVPIIKPWDLKPDGNIDLNDFAVISKCWGKEWNGLANEQADINGDKWVGYDDLISLAYQWLDYPFEATDRYSIPHGEVYVDGYLNEWDDALWIPLDKIYYQEGGIGNDLSGAWFALKWNGDRLYVAVKVYDTDHIFVDLPWNWNICDKFDLFVQGDPNGGTGYGLDGDGKFKEAQHYLIGPNKNLSTINGGITWFRWVWAMFGNGTTIPDNAGLWRAFGEEPNEPDMLIYEVGAKIFEWYGGNVGQPSVVREVVPGDMIAVDVVVGSRYVIEYADPNDPNSQNTYGYIMLSENLDPNKYWDAGNIMKYTLVAPKGSVYLRADINQDGEVNLIDFALLFNYWQTSVDTDDLDCKYADLNNDGKVNMLDFSTISSEWLSPTEYRSSVYVALTDPNDDPCNLSGEVSFTVKGYDEIYTKRLFIYLDEMPIGEFQEWKQGREIVIDTSRFANGRRFFAITSQDIDGQVINCLETGFTFKNLITNVTADDYYREGEDYLVSGFNFDNLQLETVLTDMFGNEVWLEPITGQHVIKVIPASAFGNGVYEVTIREVLSAAAMTSGTTVATGGTSYKKWRKKLYPKFKLKSVGSDVTKLILLPDPDITKVRWSAIQQEFVSDASRGVKSVCLHKYDVNYGNLNAMFNGRPAGHQKIRKLSYHGHADAWVYENPDDPCNSPRVQRTYTYGYIPEPGLLWGTNYKRVKFFSYLRRNFIDPNAIEEVPGIDEETAVSWSDLRLWETTPLNYSWMDGCNTACFNDMANAHGIHGCYKAYIGWRAKVIGAKGIWSTITVNTKAVRLFWKYFEYQNAWDALLSAGAHGGLGVLKELWGPDAMTDPDVFDPHRDDRINWWQKTDCQNPLSNIEID